MALDMIKAVKRMRTPNGEKIKIRVGVHSGRGKEVAKRRIAQYVDVDVCKCTCVCVYVCVCACMCACSFVGGKRSAT